MSGIPIELSQEECLSRLRADAIGRVAMATPLGPRIVPVNYVVQDTSIVLRTSPDSELATYGPDQPLALEIDRFDKEGQLGWSVVAHGRAARILDPNEIGKIERSFELASWAEGTRTTYLRLVWSRLTGRRLGAHHNLTEMIEDARRLR